MEKNNIMNRYEELYREMANSGDVRKMKHFGEVEKWAFSKINEMSPQTAKAWVEKLEAGEWNNYLSREEAEIIVSSLMNQDGTRGAHWDYEEFKSAVESLGGKMSDAPYYNCYALWTVANMRYSDNARSASEFVPKDKFPLYFYNVSVETLTDKDRPNFVRPYFAEILQRM